MESQRRLGLSAALFLVLTGCAGHATKTETATPPGEPVAATPPERSEPTLPAAPASPAPPPVASAPAAPSQDFVEEAALKDVFFESARTEIGPQGTVIMRSNAHWLIEHAGYLVLIEGHTDATGTPEGNLAIGQRRAKAAMDFFVKAGVAAERIETTSYGSSRPVCTQTTESCAAKNRRVHFLVKQQ